MTALNFSASNAAVAPDERPYPEESSASPRISMVEALTQLARRKWLVARVTGIALFAGITISLLIPARYTATTRIMPPHQTPSETTLLLSQLAGPATSSLAAAAGGLGLHNPNDIYIGLLQSQPIADAIIGKFDLEDVYRARDMTAARAALLANTQITSERSGLLAVSVTDKNKERAAEMANAYTDQLRLLTKTLAVTEAGQRRLFYEEQLKQSKEALISAELAFQQVQQSKGLIQLDAQARAMITSLATLRAQVGAKEVELEVLRSYATEHNPEVALAENQLAALKEQIASLEEKSRTSGFPGPGLSEVPAAGLDFLRAEHELTYQQTLFDLLLKQYDAARLDEAKDAAVIQVVELAAPPERKSSPHRAVIALWFTAIALLGMCALICLKDFVQRRPELARSLVELRSALIGR
jgi:uncharacterized protein involved in exopolysaccharide biosynthesis